MIYAPHTLQKKVVTPMQEDEYGRLVPGSVKEQWEDVCPCRCDDISAEKKISVNGVLYDYKYKVVYESETGIMPGTHIRCLDKDGNTRGEGVAKSPLQTNFLSYKVIWLE